MLHTSQGSDDEELLPEIVPQLLLRKAAHQKAEQSTDSEPAGGDQVCVP
jgi:hypothetical protein